MGCKALGFAFPLKTWYDEQVFSNIRTRDRMNQQPITAILFDLDGTLLPMEQDAFVRTYFAALAKKVAPLGFAQEPFLASMWKGTGAMLKNDGTRTNREAFWDAFAAIWGEEARALETELVGFYENEFNVARSVVGEVQPVGALLRALRERGLTLCLATNPVFPRVAVETRLSWIGLSFADFSYVTTYETAHFCKPNLGYYRETLAAIGKAPGECIMVGNNPVDDLSSLELGLSGFLITDYLENGTGMDITPYRRGDFKAMVAFLEEKLGGRLFG